MQIKARLVDPPVDARIPQITYSKINDARAKKHGKGRERFPKLLCRITMPTNLRETIPRDGINKKATGYGYFWITSPLTMV